MASADPQLEAGEQSLFRTGLHWMTFSGAFAWACFMALVATFVIMNNDLPLRTDLQIAAGFGVVAVLGALPALLRWRRTVVVLTDRRLLVAFGAWRARRFEAPLSPSLLDQRPGLTGRLLGHGTLTIMPAGGHSTTIGHVARAEQLVAAARSQARRGGRRGAGPS